MSKINQIERALQEVDGGKFQKIVDSLIVAKNLGIIDSTGSVTGADKTKPGTPDTLITLPDGSYLFAEHSVQQTALFKKFSDDLKKCFDEEKTGIPLKKIKGVLIFHTGELKSEEVELLNEMCTANGAYLNRFSLNQIAHELFHHYPRIAKDQLGIEVDTGQIVSPKDFVTQYGNNKLATRLDHAFHFRKEELRQSLEILEQQNLLLLSGPAGTGKSRLALETCEKFSEANPEYKVLCVYRRSLELWEDLKTWLSPPGAYLVFVDDANRVSQFGYLVSMLLEDREDRKLKVIATVRNYAIEGVQKQAERIGPLSVIKVAAMLEDQIKKLLKDEYNIQNAEYLERICSVSKGNPRLAIMAAEVAVVSPLYELHNVQQLYDKYFSSIREELGLDNNPEAKDFLKVGAVISFFKAVDFHNEEMMLEIQQAFGMSKEAFWDSASQLHRMELCDMYEKEIVKVSDQVLGTYLFHLAVFREGILSLDSIFQHFFPKYSNRLRVTIIPVINAFDQVEIMKVMSPAVKRKFSSIEKEKEKIEWLNSFWFLIPTDCLLWIANQIQEMESDPLKLEEIQFKKASSGIPSASMIGVLGQFHQGTPKDAKTALDLILHYFEKKPQSTPQLITLLTENFSFRVYSYRYGYWLQNFVLAELLRRGESESDYWIRVLLSYSRHSLGIEFESNRVRDRSVFESTRFNLVWTDQLKEFREKIWTWLFALGEHQTYWDSVIELLQSYFRKLTRQNLERSESLSNMIQFDKDKLLPFLESKLDSDRYVDCMLIQDYLRQLRNHNVDYPMDLETRYRCESYEIAQILLPDYSEKIDRKLSMEEFDQLKKYRRLQLTKDFDYEDYMRFFERCREIQNSFSKDQGTFNFQEGISEILLGLSDKNPTLFLDVFTAYLKAGDPFQVHPWNLVSKLIALSGFDATIALISENDFAAKEKWLFCAYQGVGHAEPSKESVESLLELYETSSVDSMPGSLEFLLHYRQLDPDIINRVASIILNRVKDDAFLAHGLRGLFFAPFEDSDLIKEVFANDSENLGKAYCALEAVSGHHDFQGKAFSQLLDLRPEFAREFVEWKLQNTTGSYLSDHDDHRDYSFIWLRADYSKVMDKILSAMFSLEPSGGETLSPYLNVFFKNTGDAKSAKEIIGKQDSYLLSFIDQHNENSDFMCRIFGLVVQLNPLRRLKFYSCFLESNNCFEDFEKLPLEAGGWSGSWSMVPAFQASLDYYRSLLPIFKGAAFLQHRQRIEHKIDQMESMIAHEKRSNFLGDF